MRFLPLALVFLTACQAPLDPPAEGEGEGEGEEKLTLDNCATTIGEGVPAFFADHFRCADMALDGDDVVISTRSLPPHDSFYYGEGHPNFAEFDTSRGPEYHPNPNTLAPQNITVRIPLSPVEKGVTITSELVDRTAQTSNLEYGLGPKGVALDSVLMFNPVAAPGDDIEEERFTFDTYEAHPTPFREYHYHTKSPGPLEVLAREGVDVEIYGVMCDGTIVLGCTELDGSAPANDVDAQSGHLGDVGEFPNRYHTHICPELFAEHPYTPEIQYYDACVVERG
jgi:hypothetical protein